MRTPLFGPSNLPSEADWDSGQYRIRAGRDGELKWVLEWWDATAPDLGAWEFIMDSIHYDDCATEMRNQKRNAHIDRWGDRE